MSSALRVKSSSASRAAVGLVAVSQRKASYEPKLGVPSISSRLPGRRVTRCHSAAPRLPSAIIARTTRPPIECATRCTGWLACSACGSHCSSAFASRAAASRTGQPPVVGEELDAMGGGEELDERAVEVVDQVVGADLGAVDRDVAQAAAQQGAVVEPHRAPAGRAGRCPWCRGAPPRAGAAPAWCWLRATASRQRGGVCGAAAIGRKPPASPSRRVSPASSQADAVRVVEVAEVIDLRAAVEAEAGAALGAAQAARHGAGIDHQVVVGTVEPVGDQAA